MSYRLINSNEISIKYPEVNEMDCIYVDLPNGLDNEYHYIDAELIKHGRWIGGKCSVCGSLRPINKVIFRGETIWERQQKENYCPNCGAKMDLDEDAELNPCRDYDEKVEDLTILA